MAVGNSLVKSNGNDEMKLSVYLQNDAVKRQINQVVGGKNGTKFISSIVSAVQSNPELQKCTSPSIVNAALLGEALNLSPSPQLGQFYMVPFENKKKKCKEAQFILGYKGYVQLAKRSGCYRKIVLLVIKEGELIKYDPVEEEIRLKLIEDDEERENTPTIGYYAMFEELNGFRKAMYWSKKKMLLHADRYSKAFSKDETTVHTKYGDTKKVSFEDYEADKYDPKDEWMYSSNWYKNFDDMALKTMLRQLISKWGIMSIDLQTAVDKDMAVIQEDGEPNYVDDGKAGTEDPDDIVSDQEMKEIPEESVTPPADEQTDAEEAFFGGLI